MSIAARPAPHRIHPGWAAFVTLEVLVVAVTLAFDFTVAGFVMAGVAIVSLVVHRHGIPGRRFHQPHP